MVVDGVNHGSIRGSWPTAFSGCPRHLSKFVKSFLSALTMRFTDRPQCFSQCFPGSYRSAEWRMSMGSPHDSPKLLQQITLRLELVYDPRATSRFE